ncbi:MAG: hypothetical protein AAFR90_14515 [Pseudomonadota bacterium]
MHTSVTKDHWCTMVADYLQQPPRQINPMLAAAALNKTVLAFNACNTTKDRHTDSWFAELEPRFGTLKVSFCSVAGCGGYADVGGHVLISGRMWITPLCHYHNN